MWKKQGAGWVGSLSLVDGRQANVVCVGSRENPKGTVLVLPEEGTGQVQTVDLSSGLEWLHPGHVLEVLCMQERAFGKSGLRPPKDTVNR